MRSCLRPRASGRIRHTPLSLTNKREDEAAANEAGGGGGDGGGRKKRHMHHFALLGETQRQK